VSKTVENAYREVNIAFANEIALICESLGVDVYEVRKLVNNLPNNPLRGNELLGQPVVPTSRAKPPALKDQSIVASHHHCYCLHPLPPS
jgi:hypothetical protein